MKISVLVLSLFCIVFSNVACITSEAVVPEGFYSSNSGPSKKSGDCGGYSFWFEGSEEKITGGKAAEYEGGCETHQKPLFDVKHNLASNSVIFFFNSAGPNQWTKVEGNFEGNEFVARLQLVERNTKKPIFKLGESTIFQRRVETK